MTGNVDGWRVLRRYAGRHAGFFTTRQVVRTGCEARVRAGLGDGSVTRAGVGLLRLAEWPVGPLDEFAMWSAWFDGAAVVCHQSAADLHGLGRLRPRFLHLSVGVGRAPVTPRLVVLRRRLRGPDVESAGPFLVTTPLRTVLDLAESEIGQTSLDEVVGDAVAIGRCGASEIRSAAAALTPRAAARLARALG
ncbi:MULTISPECIES: hypothetical protein [unclassified Nocardia]|uniref:hypothetical protein n=1 Tax=unclassified Nocardia TaxID=2637762 RepID=UPI001CE3E286|nr:MULTISPECIES: hypothetical protein [unclassified Nocardia]